MKTLNELENFYIKEVHAPVDETYLMIFECVNGDYVPTRLHGRLLMGDYEFIAKRILRNEVILDNESPAFSEYILGVYKPISERFFKNFAELKCELVEYFI